MSFFKLEKEQTEKGKLTVTGHKYLGMITVDDSGTNQSFTVMAKAFKQAPDQYLLADRVMVDPI